MKHDLLQPFETVRLRLRCVIPEDAAAKASMMTPEISRWVASWPVPFTHDLAVARIETSRKLVREGDSLPFAVLEKAGGEPIGWVMLHRHREDPRRGSLSFWLGVQHHGKGYMREIAPLAIAAGFELLDLDVIEAAAQPGNAASLAVMLTCGMQPSGERMVYAPPESERNCAWSMSFIDHRIRPALNAKRPS
jgi:ribosomal-protein-alanine N-acetyltransferase